MLMIRAEQMDALRRDKLERFVLHMCDHLRARYPEQVQAFAEPALYEKVRQGLCDAETHRITDQGDIKRYLEYLVEYGDGYYKTGPVRRILGMEISGTDKMDLIDDHEFFVNNLGKGDGGLP
jgi:hypothetical protein